MTNSPPLLVDPHGHTLIQRCAHLEQVQRQLIVPVPGLREVPFDFDVGPEVQTAQGPLPVLLSAEQELQDNLIACGQQCNEGIQAGLDLTWTQGRLLRLVVQYAPVSRNWAKPGGGGVHFSGQRGRGPPYLHDNKRQK